jgi:hypothetical protein
MIVLKETTEWNDNTPNHIYFVSDNKSKLLAYIKSGTKEVLKMSVPIAFSTTRRKFIEVKNTFGFKDEKSTNPTWEVAGSNGSTYIIEQTNNSYVCSCSGFKFRGKCKHLTEFLGNNIL